MLDTAVIPCGGLGTRLQPRGLGDAFLRARDLLEGEPFAAILPEVLFRGPNPTRAVLDVHRRGGPATALVAATNGQGATGRNGYRSAVADFPARA